MITNNDPAREQVIKFLMDKVDGLLYTVNQQKDMISKLECGGANLKHELECCQSKLSEAEETIKVLRRLDEE